jgi:hypothetical protein
MSVELYSALAFSYKHIGAHFTQRTAKRDAAVGQLASLVRETVPASGISKRKDIDELFSEWLGPFMILAEALESRRRT